MVVRFYVLDSGLGDLKIPQETTIGIRLLLSLLQDIRDMIQVYQAHRCMEL